MRQILVRYIDQASVIWSYVSDLFRSISTFFTYAQVHSNMSKYEQFSEDVKAGGSAKDAKMDFRPKTHRGQIGDIAKKRVHPLYLQRGLATKAARKTSAQTQSDPDSSEDELSDDREPHIGEQTSFLATQYLTIRTPVVNRSNAFPPKGGKSSATSAGGKYRKSQISKEASNIVREKQAANTGRLIVTPVSKTMSIAQSQVRLFFTEAWLSIPYAQAVYSSTQVRLLRLILHFINARQVKPSKCSC